MSPAVRLGVLTLSQSSWCFILATLLLSSAAQPAAQDTDYQDSVHYFVLVGPMGVGKTHLVNRWAETKMLECDTDKTCTVDANSTITKWDTPSGHPLGLIDTVGFDTNEREDGFAQSLIQTLEAMQGKIVCKVVLVYPCYSRSEKHIQRSVDLLQEITGIPPVVVQSVRGERCYGIPTDKFPIQIDSTQAESPLDLPGDMACGRVVLPEGWKERVKEGDFQHIRNVLDTYKKLQCDDAQASYDKLQYPTPVPVPSLLPIEPAGRCPTHCSGSKEVCDTTFIIFEDCHLECAAWSEDAACLERIRQTTAQNNLLSQAYQAATQRVKTLHDEVNAMREQLRNTMAICAQLINPTHSAK